MIKIVTLFSIYGLCSGNRLLLQANVPPAQQYGNFGQLCTSPDPSTAICLSTSDRAKDSTNSNPGVIKCERPNDCCLCQSISCGSDIQPCEMFSVGDNGAFGVKSISIISNDITSNIIDCKGTQSCAGTVIRGKHVKSVQCGGRYSCQNAIIIIDEPNEGFGLKCEVTGACDGLQIALNIPSVPAGFTCNGMSDFLVESIECIGVEACRNLKFIINNDGCRRMFIETVECRDGSCAGAQFTLNGNVHIDQCVLPGTGIQPMGLEKCFAGLQSLKCVTCANVMRNIMDPMSGFQLDCDNQASCANSNFNINISNIQRHELFIAIIINCHGGGSCNNANMIINNVNQKEVQVHIKCMSVGACNNGNIYIGKNVVVASFLCTDASYCQGTRINGVVQV
eukprot:72063_1